jgi:hypothetical protein
MYPNIIRNAVLPPPQRPRAFGNRFWERLLATYLLGREPSASRRCVICTRTSTRGAEA